MLLHGVKVASDVSALHNLLSTSMVQRDFRKEAGYVEAQFFPLAELGVEKYIAELSDGTRCQLAVALVYVGQVPQSPRYLD